MNGPNPAPQNTTWTVAPSSECGKASARSRHAWASRRSPLREGFPLDRNLDFHRPEFWTSYLTDYLHRIVWPVYPEIAEHLGVPGAYLFRNEAKVVDLKEFVVACYEKWDAAALDRSQLSGGQFDSLVNRSRLHRDGPAS